MPQTAEKSGRIQTSDEEVGSMRIDKDILIDAPIEIAFESLLAELGPEGQMPDGKPFAMTLEAWPGGRWFRDLGNNAGHFWGHVQVIKPPTLLELNGPMFMSYPAVSHLQYRLKSEGAGTRISLLHRAIGQIEADHREGVQKGWQYKLQRIQEIAAKLKNSKRR
jgi:hypothetical protein